MKKKLRAFRIEDFSMSSNESDVISMLNNALKRADTLQKRRMLLSKQDNDEDLLAYYDWTSGGKILFGIIMRIIPAEQGGVLSETDFSKNKITADDLTTIDEKSSQYAGHFYFAINNTHVVTTLPGNLTIERLQTYINWLIKDERGDKLIDMTPLMVVPPALRLDEIKCIEFSGTSANTQNKAKDDVQTNLFNLQHSVLELIMGNMPSLKEIQEDQLVSAQLLVKINRKPKGMSKDDYQNKMGAIVKNIPNGDGFAIRTKKGTKYAGDDIQLVKFIDVEETSKGWLNEQQLSQEMEQFLQEIKKENA